MKRVLIAISMLLFPVPAMAVGFTCTGTVQYLGINNAGYVTVSNGFGIWSICSLTNTSSSISKEACTGWYSGLLTARASARTVTLYFTSEDNSGITTCAALGNWTGPTPYFAQLD